jgi:hypothetical protein
MHVPYNTGKVEIGKYYQRPPYVEEDRDMIRIQGWLIGDAEKARKNFLINVSYMALLVLVLAVAIIKG